MSFADVARNESHKTFTENGAFALNTSGDKLLDLFGSIGSLRETDTKRIERLFADAYAEDPLTATKIVFYARDIREGLGERETFRTLIKYMAIYHPESLINNIDKIGEYGRYDDLYSLIGTPLEDDMWKVMKNQIEDDWRGYKAGRPISLLAKWIKSVDASSKATRKLGIKTALKLGYHPPIFKRMVKRLRKYIKVTEGLMSTNQWDKINYSEVPSKAMTNYRNAFRNHDEERFNEFVSKAVNGEVKINSSTLYPYDLIEKILHLNFWHREVLHDDVVESQWRQLPNYIKEDTNAIVIADTSGSMMGRPIYTAIGLAIYFAERNKGAYHNLWMSFSSDPKFHELTGETLAQKLASLDMDDWGNNTNLVAAFNRILDVAIEANVPESEMPKSIIVISDMEIDRCEHNDWTFYDQMKSKFHQHGYEIPNVVFWNVNSRHDVYHADSKRKGVQLVSGQSTTVFKQVMDCIDMTPIEAMFKIINSDRYNCITINN